MFKLDFQNALNYFKHTS